MRSRRTISRRPRSSCSTTWPRTAPRRSRSRRSRGSAAALVAAKRYDEAMTYAARTYEIVEEQLKTRKLDDEAAPADRARRGDRSAGARAGRTGQALRGDHDAAARDRTVQGHLDHHAPQQEHEPAEPRRPAGVPDRVAPNGSDRRPSLAALKGKPVVLFLWAHWCGDCKTQGPILDALVNKYKSTGITVVAPTQRFGYVEKRKPAGPRRGARLHRARSATSSIRG